MFVEGITSYVKGLEQKQQSTRPRRAGGFTKFVTRGMLACSREFRRLRRSFPRRRSYCAAIDAFHAKMDRGLGVPERLQAVQRQVCASLFERGWCTVDGLLSEEHARDARGEAARLFRQGSYSGSYSLVEETGEKLWRPNVHMAELSAESWRESPTRLVCIPSSCLPPPPPLHYSGLRPFALKGEWLHTRWVADTGRAPERTHGRAARSRQRRLPPARGHGEAPAATALVFHLWTQAGGEPMYAHTCACACTYMHVHMCLWLPAGSLRLQAGPLRLQTGPLRLQVSTADQARYPKHLDNVTGGADRRKLTAVGPPIHSNADLSVYVRMHTARAMHGLYTRSACCWS